MRWLLVRFSAFCAVMCAGSVALWVRSYWTSDSLYFQYAAGHGKVAPLVSVFTLPGALLMVDERLRPGSWTYDSVAFKSAEGSEGRPRPTFLLFRFQWRVPSTGIPSNCTSFTTMAPLWSFALVFMVGAGIWPIVALGRVRRRRKGRCPQCGYDLTGNVSGRCPECGSAVARQGRAPQSA
jgi:hypothetical protein